MPDCPFCSDGDCLLCQLAEPMPAQRRSEPTRVRLFGGDGNGNRRINPQLGGDTGARSGHRLYRKRRRR